MIIRVSSGGRKSFEWMSGSAIMLSDSGDGGCPKDFVNLN